jgi:hypothetical protein
MQGDLVKALSVNLGTKNQLSVFLIEGLLKFSLKTLQQVLGLLVQKPMPKGSSL